MDGTPSGWPTTTSASMAANCAAANSHLSSMSIWITKRPDIASVRDSVAWTIFIHTSSPLASRVGGHTPDNLNVSSGIDCSSGLTQTGIYENEASKLQVIRNLSSSWI